MILDLTELHQPQTRLPRTPAEVAAFNKQLEERFNEHRNRVAAAEKRRQLMKRRDIDGPEAFHDNERFGEVINLLFGNP